LIDILPYTLIVGQRELRDALEIGYVGRLGVLATGQRGTAKSTTIRAFSKIVYDDLPVTLPIGVTDDRVLGGWSVDALLGDEPTMDWQPGLLEKASKTGMLYIDEINLLDDHIVNLVLDAAATGILTVQRDNADRPIERHDFAMVGSMNPDEGPLRPQLLDRFALVVTVKDEGDQGTRRNILRTLLSYDLYRYDPASTFTSKAVEDGKILRDRLKVAYDRFPSLDCSDKVIEACAAVAELLQVVGHRGEMAMLAAARAWAVLDNSDTVELHHLRAVTKAALIHRRPNVDSGTLRRWGAEEERLLDQVLPAAVTP
jgi:magnesium chelatase subunit I